MMPTLKGRLFIASLLVSLAVASVDAYWQYIGIRMPLPREELRARPTPMTRVYLVAAGDLPMPFDVELVEHYERTLGLPIERLPPVPIDPSLVNTGRQQLMGDATVAWVARRHPRLAADPGAVIYLAGLRAVFASRRVALATAAPTTRLSASSG